MAQLLREGGLDSGAKPAFPKPVAAGFRRAAEPSLPSPPVLRGLLFWSLIPGLVFVLLMMNQFWSDAYRLLSLHP